MIHYDTLPGFKAFSVGKALNFEEEGITIDANLIRVEDLGLPRQTHSDHVAWVEAPGRPEDTDAVITRTPGLPVAVKTADCIPVLVYDSAQKVVAAIHAGWRGTVSRIVQKTVREMYKPSSITQYPSPITHLHAIIGPGISQESFEVGDEVYDAFLQAGFPMERIATRMEKWHIDLWEANRWLLEECGITDITVAGIDTMTSAEYFSARRETINTGRNYNVIMML